MTAAGVSFQPGSSRTPAYSQKGNGVQEAIQMLSLRLPKMVGARAVAPQALLTSPGSGDNPRVDSVVNQVLARMFPTGPTATHDAVSFDTAPTYSETAQPDQPSVNIQTPSFSGAVTYPAVQPQRGPTKIDGFDPWRLIPQIIVGLPESTFGSNLGLNDRQPGRNQPDFTVPPATIAPTPQWSSEAPDPSWRNEPEFL